jgi:hypothetical protein
VLLFVEQPIEQEDSGLEFIWARPAGRQSQRPGERQFVLSGATPAGSTVCVFMNMTLVNPIHWTRAHGEDFKRTTLIDFF